jgi:site-specific recombinase XerD
MYIEVLSLMKDGGLQESTLIKYNLYFNDLSEFASTLEYPLVYSKDIIDKFVLSNHKNFESQKISRSIFRGRRKAADVLTKYHLTGAWIYERSFSKRKYIVETDYFKNFVKEECSEYNQLKLNSKSCYRQNNIALRNLCSYLEKKGHTDFSKLSIEIIEDFLIEMKDNYKGSINKIIACLNFLLRYLNRYKIVKIVEDISILQAQVFGKKNIITFSKKELTTLLNGIDLTTSIGKRDYALILLGITTGLRSIDAKSLKLKDINWKKQIITIIQQKTGKKITLPLLPNASNAIAEYILQGRPKTKYEEIFISAGHPFRPLHSSSISDIIKRNCIRAGINKKEKCTYHSLRRSLCTFLSMHETSVDIISQCVGHSNINSADKYIALSPKMINCCLDFSGIEPIIRSDDYDL